MPIYKSLSESELITLLKDGSEHAYTEIYNRYFELLHKFAYRKLYDEDLSNDFVQELFTDLWYRREDISDNGSFASFLYTSLRNKIINYFTHQKVEAKYLAFLKDFSVHSRTENTDYLIREKELRLYIDKQIAVLPAKMRKIFKLSRYEYLSNKEIAEALETTESNVSHHVSNAVKILKTKLNSLLIFFFI